MKSTDYATIELTCRPNLLNSRPQRIGFYSKLEIPACIQGLTDLKLGARVSKIHDRISITHALVFIIFSGCATLESLPKTSPSLGAAPCLQAPQKPRGITRRGPELPCDHAGTVQDNIS